MDTFCYLSFVSVMLSCLFIAALLSPAGKRLIYLLALLYAIFLVFFCTFPYGVLGQVWYLILLIPDICLLLTSMPEGTVCDKPPAE